MAVLSIHLRQSGPKVRAELYYVNGGEKLSAECEFVFNWGSQDQEDLRWYLEDYLVYPASPAPLIADRIEKRLVRAGEELFRSLFESSKEGAEAWQAAARDLADLRVEVNTEQPQLAGLPWEILREPNSQTVLAISCGSFVRIHLNPARPLIQVSGRETEVRMLLVMCRPGGANDVPFRSVAMNLLQGLEAEFNEQFRVDVLRPPTFGSLNTVLREAARVKKPYHIVHFDGHGLPGGIVFEDSTNPDNAEIVNAQEVGQLLADSNVPILVLNACRSAFSEPPATPMAAGNIHEEIRAFGSLAQVVTDQGVPGVLAMRYNVFVETAARFMLNFYSALSRGCGLGEAATAARSQLKAEPMRQSSPDRVRLEDWIVPMAFESARLRLMEEPSEAAPLVRPAATTRAADDAALPKRPDAGFFGRDETLLALDRAFDSERVVLLTGFAGEGKTATATEFARWYRRTYGTRGPVLFTSFDTKRTLDQVIDQFGRRIESQLAQSGVQWAAIGDTQQRRDLTLRVISKMDVFWIWDNVEPIAGFPTGTESAWLPEEQTELSEFLRDASERGARFLLTSRRDESAWLKMLPARIAMPVMPFWERLQLAQSLVKKMRGPAFDLKSWRPLLEFSQGNPLTLTVLVTQALRKQIRTEEKMEEFLADLRTGAAAIHDDKEQGRSRSLTASLNYGLEHAFTDEQRKVLSLLHLFKGA
jgi:hypothetical protein